MEAYDPKQAGFGRELTDPIKIKAAATYNAAPDHFDKVAHGDWYGGRTVELLGLAAGSTVLDVPRGAGASAIPAAEIVGPTGRVIAVDLAERLLDSGRAR